MGSRGTYLVIDALRSEDAGVRNKAMDTLVSLGPAAAPAIPLLIEMLKDSEAAKRSKAADVLKSIGPSAKPAVPALMVALEDTDRPVQCGAAEALSAIGPDAKPAVPALLKLMRGHKKPRNEWLQICAVQALMRMSVETRKLVPDEMIKRIEDMYKTLPSPFERDPTKPRPQPTRKPARSIGHTRNGQKTAMIRV